MAEYHVGCGMFGNIYAGTMAPPRKDGLKMWRNKSDVTDEQVQKIICIGDRYWEMVGKFKEEDMTPDEFADYITAKSEQVEKELRERWS